MTHKTWTVGIDGGGTQCRARLVDPTGKVLGEGVAGPANSLLGHDEAINAMADAARRALARAGMGDVLLSRLDVGAGLAGLTLAPELDAFRKVAHPFASLTVESDARIACLGAHGGTDGGIVICGTGSIACARVNSEWLTLGGWGFWLGDQGSGAQLGLAAVRQAVLEADDLAPASDLGAAILDEWDHDLAAMSLWAPGATPAEYARYAPLITSCAEKGDTAAISVVKGAADDLSLLIKGLRKKGVRRVALLGGLSRYLAVHLDAEASELLVEAKGDALDGAVQLVLNRTA